MNFQFIFPYDTHATIINAVPIYIPTELYKVRNCIDNADIKGITISNIIAICDNGKFSNFAQPAFLLK